MQTSVMLKFRPSSINGKPGSLYLQFIKNRKSRVSVFKGFKIYPEEWDTRNQSFRLNTNNPQRKVYLENVYNKLIHTKSQVEAMIRELENKPSGYTLDELLQSYSSKKRGNTLSEFVEKLVTQMGNRQPRTARSYWSVVKKVKQFNQGKDIQLNEITPEFTLHFEQYMLNTGNKLNTASYYCRNLRAVFNRAIIEKVVEGRIDRPFSTVFTGNEKTTKRAIKKEAIKHMEDINFPFDKKNELDQVRWMFLLSYYLRGISFIDMAYLKKENIINGCICYTRKKTGQYFEIEITPEIQAILNKYQDSASHYLLPILKKGDSRRSYENALRKQNNGLKKLSPLIGLDKPVTTYVARHSWASIAHAIGVSLDIISQGLGHESSKTTLIYLKSFDYYSLHEANRKVIGGEGNNKNKFKIMRQ